MVPNASLTQALEELDVPVPTPPEASCISRRTARDGRNSQKVAQFSYLAASGSVKCIRNQPELV